MYFKIFYTVLCITLFTDSFEGQYIKWLSNGLDRQYWDDHLPCKERFEQGFTQLSNMKYCQQFVKNDFVIFVTSAVKNFQMRNFIRETWGQYNKKRGIPIIFVVGLSSDKNVTKSLIIEQKQYNDLIQSKFYDSYQNLTFKTISILEYSLKHCKIPYSYIIKCDDDVILNTNKLDTLISQLQTKTYLVGLLSKKTKPDREFTSKYYTSYLEYNKYFYPSYLYGPAYMISKIVIKHIYKAALVQKCFWLEDVYITGFIPKILKIPRNNYNKFLLHNVDNAFLTVTNLSLLPSSLISTINDFISIHGKSYEINQKLWDVKRKKYKKRKMPLPYLH